MSALEGASVPTPLALLHVHQTVSLPPYHPEHAPSHQKTVNPLISPFKALHDDPEQALPLSPHCSHTNRNKPAAVCSSRSGCHTTTRWPCSGVWLIRKPFPSCLTQPQSLSDPAFRSLTSLLPPLPSLNGQFSLRITVLSDTQASYEAAAL